MDDPIGFVDLTATILDAAGVKPPSEHPISGRSIMTILGYLLQTSDPRTTGNGNIWESYPRYSDIRKFPPPEIQE